jgi:hypothetical protein
MSASGLPGRRVEDMRAGTRTMGDEDICEGNRAVDWRGVSGGKK